VVVTLHRAHDRYFGDSCSARDRHEFQGRFASGAHRARDGRLRLFVFRAGTAAGAGRRRTAARARRRGTAAEAETGTLFINGQEGAYIRTMLAEMGHPQPGPTPIQTNNTVADGIATDTVKMKRTKAMDMRFYWIRDRVRQGQFRVHWKRGSANYGDYFTKHHPPSHHKEVRPTYLQVAKTAIQQRPECEGVLIPIRDSASPEPQSGLSSVPVDSETTQSLLEAQSAVSRTP